MQGDTASPARHNECHRVLQQTSSPTGQLEILCTDFGIVVVQKLQMSSFNKGKMRKLINFYGVLAANMGS